MITVSVKRGGKTIPLPLFAPCVHGGTDDDIIERCPSCSGGAKHVRECDKYKQCTWEPVNPAVMNCQKCRTEGLGYEPIAAPAGLIVPQPPALALSPTRPRAVVTIAVGEESKACLAATESHMRAYARRLDADFVTLDWPGHPDWPMSAKFAISRVLNHYERIIYADADVLFRPGCLDLFSQCNPHEMGMVDELQHHRQEPQYGREKAYQAFRASTGFTNVPHLPWMANCGVMVVPSSHKELLLPPTRPIIPAHCAEQDHTNARLMDSGLPYRLMDRRCNWQNWTDHDFLAAPHDAVLHWSGAGGGRRNRAAEIAEWAKKYPVLPLLLETWSELFEPFRGQKVKLLSMPNGNVGDVLLEVAARKLLRHFGVIEVESGEDHILVAAGGNMGGILNPDARRVREEALATGRPVTVLPQSWFGEEPLSYAKMWAREQVSRKFEPRAELAPDLSLCLTPEDLGVVLPEAKMEQGVFLREDGEALSDSGTHSDPAIVCQTPAEYLRLAASFEEITTDRLHFAICGLIAGRKVNLLPNIYHKNRSVWEYSLKQLGCKWFTSP